MPVRIQLWAHIEGWQLSAVNGTFILFIKLRSHGRDAAADKFCRREQGGHMALRRPHRFKGNILCSILNLANHVFAAGTAAVFDNFASVYEAVQKHPLVICIFFQWLGDSMSFGSVSISKFNLSSFVVSSQSVAIPGPLNGIVRDLWYPVHQ